MIEAIKSFFREHWKGAVIALVSLIVGGVATDYANFRSGNREIVKKQIEQSEAADREMNEVLRKFADKAVGKGPTSADDLKTLRSSVQHTFAAVEKLKNYFPEVTTEVDALTEALVALQKSAEGLAGPANGKTFVESVSKYYVTKQNLERKIATPDYVRSVCVPVIETCLKRFGRVVMTPGNRNAFAYPMPDEVGTIYNPAGAGFSRWGITTSQPILYYGKDPRGVEKMPQSLQSTETVEKNGHPCPKPFKLMRWLVNRASVPGEIVLDPFMGSGTTGVAAVRLGRKFIGIEFEPTYYEIARARIADALARPDLFITQPARAERPAGLFDSTGRP